MRLGEVRRQLQCLAAVPFGSLQPIGIGVGIAKIKPRRRIAGIARNRLFQGRDSAFCIAERIQRSASQEGCLGMVG